MRGRNHERQHRRDRHLRTGPPGTTPATALVAVVCHASDIFRPLGKTTLFDRQLLALVARRLAHAGYPIGARKRIRGLRLAATDADFELGAGPLVQGPIEALMLVIAGRPAALGDLSGPGRDFLAERISLPGQLERGEHRSNFADSLPPRRDSLPGSQETGKTAAKVSPGGVVQ